jgi:TRAP-type C4-dicarboxylate transport system substrate-binding protein
MTTQIKRRALLFGGALLAATLTSPIASAQNMQTLQFASVFAESDIRAEAIKQFAAAVSDDFNVETYFAATLFDQGTELTAMQRGNLAMGVIAPQDISNQVPAWSLLTAGYLFRDAAHLQAFFDSEPGAEMIAMAEEQLGVRILAPLYFGVRQLNLAPEIEVRTPADLNGIRLRMPPGDAWQFLGEALGANPTPMAYAEVYTGLQTGAIDAQDNPLPNDFNMKFYEVTSQIVLTNHLVGFDVIAIAGDVWEGMSGEEQATLQAALDAAVAWSTEQHVTREAELVEFFEGEGLRVYAPDQDAFRDHVQQLYLESDLANDWPEGMIDRINSL